MFRRQNKKWCTTRIVPHVGYMTYIGIESVLSDYPGVRFAVKAYAKLWRALDKEANDYVDTFVANSELIRDRIRRYYGLDSEVVYPPVTGNWRNEG